MTNMRTWKRWAAAGVMALGLLGCQPAKVANPLTAELAGNEPETQLDFWHTLASRPLTSNDEAFHGLLLYMDGEDKAGGYGQRVQVLKERKMLPRSFAGPADLAVSRGDLAVGVCRLLEIRGGLMMRLTGVHPRYAVKELEFLEVYPPSSPHQTFSGSEFLGIVGRVEDYQRGNPANHPAAVLPGEAAVGKPQTAPATQP